MSEIRLEDGTIEFGGEWLTADQLAERIQEKITAGDLKFADIAAALERLKKAVEDSCKLEVRLVLTRAEYDQLTAAGGPDDREAVRKAIMAFIGTGAEEGDGDPVEGRMRMVKCANCKAAIEIPAGQRPSEIRCPKCHAVGRLKAKT